jgi:hypothetical protein
MQPLSSTELAAMQSEAQATMTDTCVIQRLTPTSDGFGSQRETWNTIATTVARMGTPTGGYLAEQAARLGELASWVISFPQATDVQVNDQLVINSQTLKVQAVYNPQTISTATRVLASEIR